MMKKTLLPLCLLTAALLAGCQSASGSYTGNNIQQMDTVEQRLEALEGENAELRERVDSLTDTVASQQEALELQQKTLEDQQQVLDRQQELLEGVDTMEQWAQDAREQAGSVAGSLREEFTGWFNRIQYEIDETRVTGLGAEPQLGLLLAAQTDGEGYLWVTFDPAVWNTDNPEENGYILNDSQADTRTLVVAESTFYGVKEAVHEPITAARLREKAAAQTPSPFIFYILDDEVHMIAEQYLP